MEIHFKKGKKGSSSTLTCIRKDGSKTWTKLHVGFEGHDLAHYAVETILGFKNAFYGLLGKGYSIQDFELPKEQRPAGLVPANLSQEALQTEHLVNLLMTVQSGNSDDLDFIPVLTQILGERGLDFPDGLNPQTLKHIRSSYADLIQQWNDLEEGSTLKLTFDIGS